MGMATTIIIVTNSKKLLVIIAYTSNLCAVFQSQWNIQTHSDTKRGKYIHTHTRTFTYDVCLLGRHLRNTVLTITTATTKTLAERILERRRRRKQKYVRKQNKEARL